MGRVPNQAVSKAFAEFQDPDTPAKCAKVRCLHCGFTRAKNTTRQIEHLQECQAYLNSPEAAAHLEEAGQDAHAGPDSQRPLVNGGHPNPNLQVNRRGPNQKKRSDARVQAVSTPTRPAAQQQHQQQPPPPALQPSLTQHLLITNHQAFHNASQQPFLSHAGCGTLSASALSQWMVQDGHYSRGYIQFVGALIAKLRLPQVPNSQFHTMYRTLDLLISAVNNIRREMGFFENTAIKYGVSLPDEPPSSITRSYLDLFHSVSSPSASLLEGMVVLWATGHCCRSAWKYASSFQSSLSGPATESHIAALHQSLIPNWTSPAFSKFVDACGSLVDELANSSTSQNGKEEMMRCDQVFRQICWLEERFWPDVDGMGEEDDTARLNVGLGVNGAQGADPAVAFGAPLHGIAEAAAGATD